MKQIWRTTVMLAVAVLTTWGLAGCSTLPKQSDVDKVIDDSIIIDTSSVKVGPEFDEKGKETEPLGDDPLEAIAEFGGQQQGTAFGSSYQVGPGDTLEFISYDDPTLSRPVNVRYDGYISLPLVPDILVDGMTRDEAITAVEEAYGELFHDPSLSLLIQSTGSKHYYVMGDVSNPSKLPYEGPITLLDAVNNAGGLRVNTRSGDSFVADQGQLTKALIIRHTDAGRRVYEYDMRRLASPGAHASDTPVLPGDVVYIPAGLNLVYLIGEVQQQRAFQLREGMTLLQLLSQAGGISHQTARKRHITLLRELDGNRTQVILIDYHRMMRTGISPPLKPGDIVHVPRSRLVELNDYLTQLSNLTQPFSTVMRFYRDSFDTYYTKRRIDRLYDDNGSGGFNSQDLLSLQQQLIGLGSAFTLP